MKKWTIRWRIVGSFAVILTVMTVTAAVGYARLARIQQITRGIAVESLPGLSDITRLSLESNANYSRTQEFISESDMPKRQKLHGDILASRVTMNAFLSLFTPTVSTQAEQDLLDTYKTAQAAYREEQDKVLKAGLDSASRREDLLEQLRSDVKPKFVSAQVAAEAVRTFNEVGTDESTRLIADAVARAKEVAIVSVAFGLLVAFVCGYYLLRAITEPLGQLTSILNVMCTGDLSRRLTSDRSDEFGTVANGFNRMSDQLARLVGQVQQSGVQVNASVMDISVTAREQQATASEVAATTTEIGATSREISARSQALVGTMHEVATVAENSAFLASQGQGGLTQMEETMTRVMDAAATISVKLAVLNEKAGNISQVVTTITKVAEQTNLLSLNAAIEAEKAGEYGRGFSVVATEIRRLADQTAVATDDIAQMVREIQSAVAAGVMGMDKFSEEVRRGMQDVHHISGQLSQVIQQVQELSPRVESVSDGMRAQASGAEQITQALAQLREAAQQTVDSLTQSQLAIDELNRVAVGLDAGVSRFTLQAA
jgi:methyl-accepting chemotaxis protein WspA